MLEMLQKKANEMFNGNTYTDDWCWNDDETVIQFTVMEYRGMQNGRPNEVNRGTYRFIYKEDDIFERTAEEQIDEWLEELSYRF